MDSNNMTLSDAVGYLHNAAEIVKQASENPTNKIVESNINVVKLLVELKDSVNAVNTRSAKPQDCTASLDENFKRSITQMAHDIKGLQGRLDLVERNQCSGQGAIEAKVENFAREIKESHSRLRETYENGSCEVATRIEDYGGDVNQVEIQMRVMDDTLEKIDKTLRDIVSSVQASHDRLDAQIKNLAVKIDLIGRRVQAFQ
ncbi:hypothetical protein P280DRAFT_475799 [Massarina eburnea CBS 473.64]|uniref:Uncharacterized protein n=1 Tax=Massarina eburnea CBS 473.64 TaxID=1395130 RepID=A0A6A6SDJ7_9PLEO|nr:hypothetical protein P280DRAFT_475799 [Massarina eburnea CBS 473.64]